MWELVKAGGWLMAPIVVCSVLALAIILERSLRLRTQKVTPDGLANAVIVHLHHQPAEASWLAQLAAGQVEAVGVNSRFLTQFSARHGMAYREIYTSEGFAEIPVIAHPRVSMMQVTAIRQALLEMRQDSRGEALLEAAGFVGFEPASERQYDNVRRIYRGN